jgi:hypothetical protein
MTSVAHETPSVHLVDIDGFDVPSTEKDLEQVSYDDPARWPWWTDLDAWTTIAPISGGAPEPSAADRREFESWLATIDDDYPPADQAEEVRAWLDANPGFSAWLDSQGGPG